MPSCLQPVQQFFESDGYYFFWQPKQCPECNTNTIAPRISRTVLESYYFAIAEPNGFLQRPAIQCPNSDWIIGS